MESLSPFLQGSFIPYNMPVYPGARRITPISLKWTAKLPGSPLVGDLPLTIHGDYTPLLARDSESEGPQVCWQEFRQTGTDKPPRVHECYWAHFAAEIHLSE